MPTYIALLRWTPKGVEKVKDSPSRLDKAREAFKKAGGNLKAFYMTLGEYDGVAIAEAPDDATYTRIMLSIAAQGNVRSETLRAFTEDEYRKILGGLS